MTMTQQTYHVHAVEQDLAGKWYARVVISDDEAVFIKFDDYPDMPSIQRKSAEVAQARVRVRNELGQFVGDDPATPDVNEAWTVPSDAPAQ